MPEAMVHQTGNQTATIQSFGRGSAEFVFIGFELIERGASAPSETEAAPSETAPSDSSTSGEA